MIEKPKKERRFLKALGRVGEILLQEVLLKLGSSLIKKIGGKKTLPSILFLLASFSLFAQFPNTGNKQRLGFQTTGDGLTWRGSISDTVSIQPINNQNAWVILDTINLKFYSFDFTSNTWNALPQVTNIDTTSLSNRINLKLNLSDTASMLTNYLRTGTAASTYQTILSNPVTGTGTINYIPKFTSTGSTIGDANLFTNGNRFVQNENTDQSFGWDKMLNTSSPFFGNNVKAGSTNETIQRVASTTNFNPSAIIFGLQRTNNGTGASSLGGINFMTTSGNPSGDINPIDSSRMFIEPRGNIGIGKMQPYSFVKLDVNGNLAVNGISYNFNNVNNRNGYLYLDHAGVQVWKIGLFNDNTSTLSLGNGDNFNRIFNIANNGNIGINDTTPSYSLDVNGGFASNGLFRFGGATNYLMQNFDAGGFYSEIQGTTSNNRHIRFQGLNDAQEKYTSINLYAGLSTIMFRTDDYNKMQLTNNLLVINEDSQDTDFRVESDGNINMVFVDASTDRVGIGTNTPDKTLHVNGEVKIATVTATPTSLLGKDASNVVGEVTTVAQTGLFGRGSVTNAVTDANGIITVAHGFSFTPIMAFANLSASTTNIVNVKEVDGTNIVFVVRDGATNNVLNTQSVTKIEFFAIK